MTPDHGDGDRQPPSAEESSGRGGRSGIERGRIPTSDALVGPGGGGRDDGSDGLKDTGSRGRTGASGSRGTSTEPAVPREEARREAALRRTRRLSRVLDEAVRVPGTNFRVGLDPVLGILPGAGDAVAAAISLYPVAAAYRFGASNATIAKMLAIVAVDFVGGSVPLLGPVFDAFWKANMWNVGTLESVLREE